MKAGSMARVVRPPIDADDDRGATFAIIALVMFALLVSAALAVDLSALERRGQVLQNSVDAAALAGVATWANGADAVATRTVVDDVLNQNGIELGADLVLDLQFPRADIIEVTLIDSEPTVLLGGIVGFGGQLERTASARHEVCADDCFQQLDIAAPFGLVVSIGSGDGLVPVSVGDRSYAVNRNASTIECLDRSTGAPCWPAQQLLSSPVTTTQMPHAAVIDDRVYYAGWDGPISTKPTGPGWLRVGCWNTTADTRCADEAALLDVGDGLVHAHDGRLFVFAGDRRVYCLEAVTLSPCADYLGGRPSALFGEPGWGGSTVASATNADRVAHGDRVWVTLANDGAVWLHCWDFGLAAPCSGFSPQRLHDTQVGTSHDSMNGRLFFHRDPLGAPTAICSFGERVPVECFDLDMAVRDVAAEAALSMTLSTVLLTPDSFVGVSTWHPSTNRHFFVSTSDQSTTYCYDFTAATACGERFTDSTFGPTAAYGYEALGDCLIGYGASSIFFALQPDLTPSCGDTTATFELDPCTCSGALQWPSLMIGDDEGVATFRVRMLGPTDVPVLPADGSWIDMTDEPVVLDGIDTALGSLTIETRITITPGQDPWADGVPPSLVVDRATIDPRLVS